MSWVFYKCESAERFIKVKKDCDEKWLLFVKGLEETFGSSLFKYRRKDRKTIGLVGAESLEGIKDFGKNAWRYDRKERVYVPNIRYKAGKELKKLMVSLSEKSIDAAIYLLNELVHETGGEYPYPYIDCEEGKLYRAGIWLAGDVLLLTVPNARERQKELFPVPEDFIEITEREWDAIVTKHNDSVKKG